MNEDGFRAYLCTRLTPRSASNYLSNARRVEMVLGIDLQNTAGIDQLETLEQRLRGAAAEFTEGSLADCLTALRTYFKFAAPQNWATPVAVPEPTPREASNDKWVCAEPLSAQAFSHLPDLKVMSVRQLLALHGGIITELRGREVVRTGNAPLGDYAEYLFSQAFGWKLIGNSSSGHDAEHGGMRYQIKGRRIGPSNPSRQLGALRRLPDVPFDVLAAVLFDGAYGVSKGILIPHSLVLERARHVAHTNSWRMMLDDGWWSMPGTTDVTAELRDAQG